jgi:hypothetical protein
MDCLIRCYTIHDVIFIRMKDMTKGRDYKFVPEALAVNDLFVA